MVKQLAEYVRWAELQNRRRGPPVFNMPAGIRQPISNKNKNKNKREKEKEKKERIDRATRANKHRANRTLKLRVATAGQRDMKRSWLASGNDLEPTGPHGI